MKKFNLFFLVALAAFSLTLASCGDDDDDDDDSTPTPTPTEVGNNVVTITGNITSDRTLSADTTYILDGFVFVTSGNTLTIPAGTVIKGEPGFGEGASALIIARGATITAEGTADNPIIMTALADDVESTTDLPSNARGLWGGLIVLGDAGLNTDPSTQQIEGIPTSITEGNFGGSNDAHNGGTLKYVSIRHGGSEIGAGNEINGLTLGGVGTGTTIDYIEVYANLDDGVEFFGGTAQVKHCIVSFCGDDSYDWDMGFRGKGQFWVAIQDPSAGDNGAEQDGGTSPEDGTPYATPEIYNATFMGRYGASRALRFRDNSGGYYRNSIFYNWGIGVTVEDLEGDGEDSRKRLEAGELELTDNVWWAIVDSDELPADSTTINRIASEDYVVEHLGDNNNTITNPGLTAPSSNRPSGEINVIPSGLDAAPAPSGDFFDASATHYGAFGSSNWASGWTFMSNAGFFN